MLKGEQVLMGLKSYKEEVTQNKRVNAKTKKKTKKKKGFWVTASHTLEQDCVHRIKSVCAG